MSDSHAPGVDWGKFIDPKYGGGKNMHYHKLRHLFERHGGTGGYDALLNGP